MVRIQIRTDVLTPGRRQSKTLLKSLEMALSKTLFLTIFLSTFVESINVFGCRPPCVVLSVLIWVQAACKSYPQTTQRKGLMT